MKKFTWRLERLLEVRRKQEDIARAELARLNEEIKNHKDDLRRRIENRLEMLEAFGTRQPQERIEGQQAFLNAMRFVDEAIEKVRSAIASLEKVKIEKTAAYLELRQARKSLEKLRARAVEEYAVQYRKFEQDHGDETTGIAYARQTLAARAGIG
jgi:flagellar FliJ protein